MRFSRALALPLAIVLAATGQARPAAAAVKLEAVGPAEGATVGPRPVFRFSAPSGWASEGGAVVELSRDRWKSIEKAWDIRISTRGWEVPPEPLDRDGAFRCTESLSEGAWEWRVRSSEGTIDGDPPRAASFKVDATPPAEIEGLKLRPRPEGALLLTWDPVIEDVEGKPETVDHYVVYRYGSRGTFPQTPPMAIGRTTGLSFLDRHPAPGAATPPSGPPRAQSDLGSDQPPARGPRTGDAERGSAPGAGEKRSEGAAPGNGSGGRAADTSAKGRASGGKDPAEARAGDSYYYKVVAVDLAGNELGIRDLPQQTARPLRSPPRVKPAD